MGDFLYWIVEIIAKIHNKILTFNDSCETVLDDKQLHFLVIGILGMFLLMIIYPLFKALSKNHILVITWIYVFTVIIVITFAIEIGQKVTGTGNMEFADILSGVAGFLAMFIVFAIVRWLFHMIVDLFKN
ncbi:hypothetical protein ACTNBM_00410 [Lachnospiraceae bacterium HCP1S3_C3]|nr:hypothetical protein [Lachnospiraceae bacterium]